MKYSSPILLAITAISVALTGSHNAYSEEQAAPAAGGNCDISCPAGGKVVSFTDGNNVACICSPESQMVPTVQDPEDVDQGEYEDEGQKE